MSPTYRSTTNTLKSRITSTSSPMRAKKGNGSSARKTRVKLSRAIVRSRQSSVLVHPSSRRRNADTRPANPATLNPRPARLRKKKASRTA